MDRGAWQATVHGNHKSWTQLKRLSSSSNTVSQAFPCGSAVKTLSAVQELLKAWVRSLGWEDPMEEGLATHSSILAWRIPWMEEPGRLQSTGL